MKYTAPLDINTSSSHSIILEQIMPETQVLEFGPAQGQMTKYLREHLHCSVSIVEIDSDAATIASQYADRCCICDIESYRWKDEFVGLQFDYIIFADVIEHLKNPEEVLLHAKAFLKYTGSFLISTPNIAHTSVLLNLWRNRFEYNNTGILDNTHIKFFTKESLDSLFNKIHLYPIKKFATYSRPGENEIYCDYNSVPEIPAFYWKTRKYGCVYQYIYELKKNYDLCTEFTNYVTDHLSEYYYDIQAIKENSQIYHRRQYLYLNNACQYINLDMEKEHIKVNSLNITLLNAPAVIEIVEGYVISDGNKYGLYISKHNADIILNNKYFFATNIPNIEIETNLSSFEFLYLELKYSNVDDAAGIIERIFDINIAKSIVAQSMSTLEQEKSNLEEKPETSEVEDHV